MAKRKKGRIPWLLLGAVGIGGYLLYKNSNTTSSATATTTTPLIGPTDTAGGGMNDIPVTPNPINQVAIISPVATVSPAAASTSNLTNVTVSGEPLPTGISQQVYNKVYSWAKSDGRIPVMQMANALIPSEYTGMYDLITNDWEKTGRATPAQTLFWNNLRDKYDPKHIVW